MGLRYVCKISKGGGLYLDSVIQQLGLAKRYKTQDNDGSIQVYIETDMSNEKLSKLGKKILRIVEERKKSGQIQSKIGPRYIKNNII